jgi:glycosyltransferase domain-containing protein
MTPKEIELLSELTIIIPTYNRPLELERAIEYWRNIPVTVHILDGTPKPCFEIGTIVSSSAKISYHSLPTKAHEKFMENYSLRVNQGMSLIKSKYAALLADDDYFTIQGLCKSLEILSSDDKIDAVIGKCATYCFYGNKIEWKKKYLNWIPNNLLKDESLAVRVENDVGKYSVYYGILRSEKLKEIHTRANQFVFSDFRINEWVAHHLGLAYCRTQLIEDYLWVRQRALVKNPYYSHKIKSSDPNEQEVLAEIFETAITNILPSVSADIKLTWTMQKVNLIEERLKADDLKRTSEVMQKRSKNLELATKKLVMNLFLKTPSWLQSVLLKCVPRRFLRSIDGERPPEFESRNDLERLLTMPREDLRLRASI